MNINAAGTIAQIHSEPSSLALSRGHPWVDRLSGIMALVGFLLPSQAAPRLDGFNDTQLRDLGLDRNDVATIDPREPKLF